MVGWLSHTVVVVAAVLAGWQALAESRDFCNEEILKGLRSEQASLRGRAFGAVDGRRRELIPLVLRLAREAEDVDAHRGKKERAIDVLGELRAEEAVPFLLDTIDFSPPTRHLEWGEYGHLPCVGALVKIGNRSAREIWKSRLQKADGQKLPLYLLVLKRVWGKEICTALTKAWLEKPLPDQHKKNLETALEYFKTSPTFTEDSRSAIRGTQTINRDQAPEDGH